MVKLLYIALYRTMEPEAVRLGYGCDLSQFGFFSRGKILRHFHVVTRSACRRAESGSLVISDIGRGEGTDSGYTLYIGSDPDGLICTMVTDRQYPRPTVHIVMREEMRRHRLDDGWKSVTSDRKGKLPSLSVACVTAPKEIDKLDRVSSQLDELKEVLHQHNRDHGETLESLDQRQRDLERSAHLFVRNAEKLPKYTCCWCWCC